MSAADVDDIEVLDVVIHASIGAESAVFGQGSYALGVIVRLIQWSA